MSTTQSSLGNIKNKVYRCTKASHKPLSPFLQHLTLEIGVKTTHSMFMKKVLLTLFLMTAALASVSAYTVFPDFKGKSFTLGTGADSYTIDNAVLTQKFDGLQVEQYADRIWRITDGDQSALIIMTENRKDIDTALFTLAYLKADTTAIISPYTGLGEKDIEAISPDFLFQMEFPEELYVFLDTQQVTGVQLSAGDVIEISGDSAWTWSMAGNQRIIYITCPSCGEKLRITLPL